MASNLTVIEHDSIEAALAGAAGGVITMSGAMYVPCTVFKQGDRTMISTALPYLFLADANKVRMNSAAKGSNPATSLNRPKIPEHVKTIHDYMLKNPDDYFLPPVTLNVGQATIHIVRGWNGAPTMAFLVIYSNTRFSVTDGQHRLTAIIGQDGKGAIPRIFDVNERFEQDSMAVLIVVEDDSKRVHQDFADAAHTKAIPPSMLAVYNMREPMNRVLSDIVEGTPVFHDRVDMTSATLSKGSQMTFLLNQVRQMVKALLFGDAALAEDRVSILGAEIIGSEEKRSRFVASTLVLTRILCEHMQPWKTIVTFPTTGETAGQIPGLRNEYFNLTATGLVVIGRVIHEINKTEPDTITREQLYRRLATEIDWRRSAEMWRGNVILAEGKVDADGKPVFKVATNRGPVNIAVAKVQRALGLDHDKDLLAKAEIPGQTTAEPVTTA